MSRGFRSRGHAEKHWSRAVRWAWEYRAALREMVAGWGRLSAELKARVDAGEIVAPGVCGWCGELYAGNDAAREHAARCLKSPIVQSRDHWREMALGVAERCTALADEWDYDGRPSAQGGSAKPFPPSHWAALRMAAGQIRAALEVKP